MRIINLMVGVNYVFLVMVEDKVGMRKIFELFLFMIDDILFVFGIVYNIKYFRDRFYIFFLFFFSILWIGF